jgi:hypothetical protein
MTRSIESFGRTGQIPLDSRSGLSIPERFRQSLSYRGIAEDITRRKRAEIQSAAFSNLGFRLSSAPRRKAARIIVDIALGTVGLGFLLPASPHPGSQSDYSRLDHGHVRGGRVAIPSTAFSREPSPMMIEVVEKGARLVNRGDREAPTL